MRRVVEAAIITACLAVIFVIMLTLPTPREVLVPTRADSLNIPYTFSNFSVADANQVNSNFSAVAAVVNGAINDTNIEASGITGSSKLVDASVSLGKMATDSVNGSKIVDASVAEVDLDIGDAPVDNALLWYDENNSQLNWSEPCTQIISSYAPILSGTGFTGQKWDPVPYWDPVKFDDPGDTDVRILSPTDMKITKMLVKLNLTVSASITFNLQINGVNTAANCVITDGGDTCSWEGEVLWGTGSAFTAWSQTGEIYATGSTGRVYLSACIAPTT